MNITQTRIEAIPSWRSSRFLLSLHNQCAVRTLTANQIAVLRKIERENGIEFTVFDGVKFLDSTMKGWARAWAVIEAKYGNLECESPMGEVWQYMGSVRGLHEFRHRDYNGRKVNEFVPISASDFEKV